MRPKPNRTWKAILRRIVLAVSVFSLLGLVLVLYACGWETRWLRHRQIHVGEIEPLTIVHLSDLHFKGDEKYLGKVVRAVNDQKADLVCITGDLVEDKRFLKTCLAFLETIQHPVYAVPGNHEHWARLDFDQIDRSMRKKGGRFLVNESVRIAKGFSIVGLDDSMAGRPDPERALRGTEGTRRIILLHTPLTVRRLEGTKFALALAGHSHGGQVRLPLWGALIVPSHVGGYDRGLYETPSGPLYVTTGVGTYRVNVRFCCRPEIVVITSQIEIE